MKVVECLNAVNHTHGDASHDHANHAGKKCNQRRSGESQSSFEVVELQIVRPIAGSGRTRTAGSTTDMTEQ